FTLLARNTQAGFLDEAEIHALERVRPDQRVPEDRGISEPPCSRGIPGDAALPQVLARDLALRVLPEDALVEDARFLVHLAQRRPARRAPRFLSGTRRCTTATRSTRSRSSCSFSSEMLAKCLAARAIYRVESHSIARTGQRSRSNNGRKPALRAGAATRRASTRRSSLRH